MPTKKLIPVLAASLVVALAASAQEREMSARDVFREAKDMELGYLMPPMGENLFLSAYRFDKPLLEVYRSTLPYALILLLAVLAITYIPALTLWPVEFFLGPAAP